MGNELYISYPETYSKLPEHILSIRQNEIIDDVLVQLDWFNISLIKSIDHIRNYDKNSLKYLIQRLEILNNADVIYFADGWQKDKVCCIEYDIATKYNKRIVYSKDK